MSHPDNAYDTSHDDPDPLLVAQEELVEDARRIAALIEAEHWAQVINWADEVRQTAQHIAQEAQARMDK